MSLSALARFNRVALWRVLFAYVAGGRHLRALGVSHRWPLPDLSGFER